MATTASERLAYAAGLFDGEGYIGLSHQGGRQSVVVRITPFGPSLFAELFGGRVKLNAVRQHNWRPQFEWTLSAVKAERAIRALYPWLREKREQADVALAIRALQFRPGGTGHSMDTKAKVAELGSRLSLLKRERYS